MKINKNLLHWGKNVFLYVKVNTDNKAVINGWSGVFRAGDAKEYFNQLVCELY